VVEYCDSILTGVDEMDIDMLQDKIKNAIDEDEEKWGKLVDALEETHGWDRELGEFNPGEGPEGDEEKLRDLLDEIKELIRVRPTFVEIKFCPQCNNMLYPKEDREQRKLLYWCKICQYTEPAEDPCVYINSVTQDLAALDQVTSDLATDPTLQHSGDDIKCPKCDHHDAVQFQTPIAREKSNMRLYYVCTKPSCRHKWAGDIQDM